MTINNPLVSIRLMVYNNAPFIRDTMDGIMSQKTNFNFEIIVGDDFSTDKTLDIIKTYKSTERIQIKILDRPIGGDYWAKRKESGTHLTNFIDILNHCRGKYIALLDGDDYWTDPYKLKKQVLTIEKTHSDCCNTLWQTLQNDEVYDKGGKKCPEASYYILEKGKMEYFHTSTRFVKKKVIEEILNQYPKELIADTPLQIILNQYYKVVILCEYTSVYRISGEGIWTGGNESTKHKMHYHIYKHLSKYIPERKYEFLRRKWDFFFLQFSKGKFIKKIPKRWINRIVRFIAYIETKISLF